MNLVAAGVLIILLGAASAMLLSRYSRVSERERSHGPVAMALGFLFFTSKGAGQ